VASSVSDDVRASVYASLSGENGELHVILLSKTFHEGVHFAGSIRSERTYRSARLFGFNEKTSQLIEMDPLREVNDGTFQYIIPRKTAVHLIFSERPL
jgi:hypothetical protein